MIRKLLIVASVLLAGLLLQACSSDESTPAPSNQSAPAISNLSVGMDAPDFTLPTASGSTVSLDDYRGKQPVLLFFHMAAG